MSGSKYAQARPNPAVELQRELTPLLQQLNALRQSYETQSRRHPVHERKTLEQAVHNARSDYDQFRVGGEKRDRLYSVLEQSATLLSDCSIVEQNLISSSRINAQIADIERVISSRSIAGLRACKSSSQSVIAETHRALANLKQLSNAESKLQALLEPVGYYSRDQGARRPNTDSSAQQIELERAREAALSAQRAREAHLAKQRAFREIADAVELECSSEEACASDLSEDVHSLGEFSVAEHQRALDQARGLLRSSELDEGVIEEARRLFEGAMGARVSAEELAEVNFERVKERDLLAAHLSANLIDLHYDDPDVYLEDDEAGERSDLILFARSPSENLSVRVVLDLVGGMRFDIDGVPTGEERTCVSLLNGFREATAQAEFELSILDYGRAGDALSSTPGERVKRIERQKAKERHS